MNQHQKAAVRVERMTIDELEAEWISLEDYDPRVEYAPGMPMDDWAMLVATERSRRAATERRKAMAADIARIQAITEKQR